MTSILARMGLNDAVLGEAKANANRVTNFDAANTGRLAAARQRNALESLHPAELPPALREMLGLRLDNPGTSLTELATIKGMPRSAANHRLRPLIDIGRVRMACKVPGPSPRD